MKNRKIWHNSQPNKMYRVVFLLLDVKTSWWQEASRLHYGSLQWLVMRDRWPASLVVSQSVRVLSSVGDTSSSSSSSRIPVRTGRHYSQTEPTNRCGVHTGPRNRTAAAFGGFWHVYRDTAFANIWTSRLTVKLRFHMPAWCVAGYTLSTDRR